jgi:hypothetical protein
MKIKINTSTNLTLSEALSDVDLSYGFTMYDKNNRPKTLSENDSFAVKLLSKLDKFFGTPQASKDFTHIIAKATQYLNNTLGQDVLQGTTVQINNKSGLTSMLRTYGILANTLDPHQAHASILSKKIVMGENYIKVHSSRRLLVDKYSEEKIHENTLFHEFSHTMEIHFYNKNEIHYNDLIDGTLSRLNQYNQIEYINKLDKKLKEEQGEKFIPVERNFFKELYVLRGEIYADVGALLLERNYEIEKGTYNPEQFKQYIEDIKTYRTHEHASIKKLLSSQTKDSFRLYLNQFNHLTTFGVDGLFDRIKDFDNNPLNENEINKIAQHCVAQGISRAFLTAYYVNDDNQKQLMKFCNNYINTKDEVIDKSDNPEHVKIILSKFKVLAGENWSKSFDSHIEKTSLSNANEINKMESIFYHGVKTTNKPIVENPTYLDKVMATPELKEAMLEYLLSNNSTKPEKLLELETKHALNDIIKNTSIVAQSIKDTNTNQLNDLKSKITNIRNKTLTHPQETNLSQPKLKM